MRRFIEWDSIEVRVSGEKLSALVEEAVAREPIGDKLTLTFANGLLRVDGAVKKIFTVPFTVEIREILATGTTIRVPLARVSAGPIKVPSVLIGMIRDKLPKDLVRYEDPATLVVSLDRFLPSFVVADVQKIWIIDGGLAVTLGRGGADLPLPAPPPPSP